MALFKKEEKKDKNANAENSASKPSKKDKTLAEPKNIRYNDIIIAPRITEKSVHLMDKGVYTFNVLKGANKTEIAKAIKELYNVEPVKVRIVNYPAKKKMDYKSGKLGRKSGGKKAMVYLKEGDKISII